MSAPLLLAIDQGTTNTKVLLADLDSGQRWHSSVRTPISFPRPGWVESDPDAVWQSVGDALAACLDGAPDAPIAAVGISNQRESVVAWDRDSGTPLGPMVSWQCSRSTELCAALRAAGHGPLVERTTGLRLDPMFSATKIGWLLDSIDDGRRRAAAGEICVGTVDTWLIWKLTGGAVFATDSTNASRTLLADLRTGDWSADLLDLFGIPRECLPDIRASADFFGDAELGPAGRTAPISGVAGDSHAALIGHGALEPGAVKATFGTGASVMTPVHGLPSPDGLSATVAWSTNDSGAIRPVYAIEGNIYAAGAALDWTAELLGVDVTTLDATARDAATAGGVQLVPAFTGLGAPHWAPTARGLISGLTRAAGRAEVARAAFESVAHQVADVIDALTHSTPVESLLVDGGAMRSTLLASLVADLTGVPVDRSEEPDIAALGAIALAAHASGLWADLAQVRSCSHGATSFEPTITDDERTTRREEWTHAVRRALPAAP